jgi:hypothetical protein
MSDRAAALVRYWGARLAENALAARALAEIRTRPNDVQRCALDGLQRENVAFERAAGEQFQKEAVGHCHDILNAMLAVATGRAAANGVDLFGFVRFHAIRRARQRFPLAGSLNAYRLAHKGYWTVIRESILSCAADEREAGACSMMLSEFLLEFFDVVSGIMTDAYLAEEKLLLTQYARARIALIDDLLHARPPGDIEARELAERCGIRPGAHIAVAIVQPLAPVPAGGAMLDRLSELIGQALAARGFGTLAEKREGAVLVIATAAAEAARSVASVLGASLGRRNALGLPVGAGVSLDVTDLKAVPQAYQEAERALEFAEASRPVVHVGEIDLIELLLRRPDAAALRLIPPWADRFRIADGAKAGALSRTIRAFADCNLSVKQTARQLDLHTNTVYFRLNRIRDLTGVDPRSFSGASLLLTTLRLIEAKTGADGAQRLK